MFKKLKNNSVAPEEKKENILVSSRSAKALPKESLTEKVEHKKGVSFIDTFEDQLPPEQGVKDGKDSVNSTKDAKEKGSKDDLKQDGKKVSSAPTDQNKVDKTPLKGEKVKDKKASVNLGKKGSDQKDGGGNDDDDDKKDVEEDDLNPRLPPEFDYTQKKGWWGERMHDGTIEYFDKYSNLEVGTDFDTVPRGELVGCHTSPTENFVFIVDLDFYEYHKIGFHGYLGEVLQSSLFRSSILLLVIINSILIGIYTSEGAIRGRQTTFQILDQIILSIFVFEIILKWLYDFRMFWKVFWNVLDFIIVMLVLFSTIVPELSFYKNMFSVMRIIRAFRLLQSIYSLSSLNVVTQTIITSLVDMMNILFVLILFMFVMAIFGVLLFDVPLLETAYFHNAFDAWFVLFVCVTQDGWVNIMDEYRPDDDDQVKQNYFIVISIYLMFGVAIGAFVFTNLIIAVVVANLELAVLELRAKKLLHDNPLEFHGEFSAQVIEILSVYKIFADQNLPLQGQRPMKIPNLSKISPRNIQAYLALVVALEQNMLEFVLIERDLKKLMKVLLTIDKELEGIASKNLKSPNTMDANKAPTTSQNGAPLDTNKAPTTSQNGASMDTNKAPTTSQNEASMDTNKAPTTSQNGAPLDASKGRTMSANGGPTWNFNETETDGIDCCMYRKRLKRKEKEEKTKKSSLRKDSKKY